MPEKSNYTEIPNEFLDNLSAFTHIERTLILVICRQTFGWHRESHVISLSFFHGACKINRTSIVEGLESLVDKKCLERKQEGNSFSYRIIVSELPNAARRASTKSVPATGTKSVPAGSTKSVPFGESPGTESVPVASTKSVPVLVPISYPNKEKEIKAKETPSGAKGPPSLFSLPSEKPSQPEGQEPPDDRPRASNGRLLSEMDLVLKAWMEAHEAVLEEKYVVVDRDRKSAKELAAKIKEGATTMDEFIKLATTAWRNPGKGFHCRNNAASLFSFIQNINNIRQELRPGAAPEVPVFAQIKTLETKRKKFMALLEHQETEMTYEHNRTPVRVKAAEDTREKIRLIDAQISQLSGA